MNIFKCLALTTMLFVSTSVTAACDKVLTNGWGIEWIPFEMGTPDNPSGFDMEMLEAIVKASGCTLKHSNEVIPWARRLHLVKKGLFDLTVGVSISKERKEAAYFTDAYRNEIIGVYVRKTDVDKYSKMAIDEIIDSDFVMGGELGNHYGNVMDGYLKRMGKNRMYRVIRNEQNMRMLIKGRIDGYIGFLPAETLLIKEQGYEDEIVLLPNFKIKTGGIHIMLTKKNNSPEILKALNSGLSEIRRNGTYDEIIKKYSEIYNVDEW